MFCHACRTHVEPHPPKTIWKLLLVAFWASSLVIALLFSIFIGINLILAPAAIAIGCSVGTAARRVSCWSCPRCKNELVPPAPVVVGAEGHTPGGVPLVPARAH